MSGKIHLRPMQQSDLPLFRGWLTLAHVAAWYLEPQDWIMEIEQQDGAFSFVRHFIAMDGEVPFGFCQYYPYWMGGEDWHGTIPVEGTYSIDYLIGEVGYLGKGYGRQMILALLELNRKEPDAKRVIVQPEPENSASCGVLDSCGFAYDESNKLYLLEL